MHLTIQFWTIPTIITVIFLFIMFRPYHTSHMYDFGQIFRLFWLIPICITWVIYFWIRLCLKK